MRFFCSLSMAILAFATSFCSAWAQAIPSDISGANNLVSRYSSIDQVISDLDGIYSTVNSNQVSSLDVIIIRNKVSALADLRMAIGVTGYDQEDDFKNGYWSAQEAIFSRMYQGLPYVADLQNYQYTLGNGSAGQWTEYFKENWEENREEWSQLMVKSGITSESDQAETLAAIAYFANFGRVQLTAKTPEELRERWPTYIWPWCDVAPD